MEIDKDVQDKIGDQMMMYSCVRGSFGNPMAIRARERRLPTDWWLQYGVDTPKLQSFALRILGLCCSSSGRERNWSVFEFRNRLMHKRLNDLVFVQYNRRLRERFNEGKNHPERYDPICLEELDWGSSWMTKDGQYLVHDGEDFTWADVDQAMGASLKRIRRGKMNMIATSSQSTTMVDDEDEELLEEEDEDTNDDDGGNWEESNGEEDEDYGGGEKTGINKRRKITIGVGVGVVGFLLAGVLCFLLSRNVRARTGPSSTPLFRTTTSSGPPSQKGFCFKFSNDHAVSARNDISADHVPFLDFKSVKAATSNFSDENKLGEGGFGPVYKGKLSGGDEVAVKRLSKLSKQGHQEFSNEVRLIAKLQHKNLVRLLGSCAHQGEKLLIYEYMPNKSLDKFIFDPRRSAELSWQKRFGIIEGIANGLLYLHHYSRMRVIHRDLKTGNILLDSEMNPKISDFGLARIFGADQMEANTGKVVGTFGYMSPEYASQGLFSEKSDVFSFGVILLEIITGERSTSFYPHKNSQTLIGYVWRMWEEGRALELLDPSMGSSPSQAAAGEVLKCIQLGLLCVQQDAAERPTMSYVVSSLSSETCVLPNPGQPAFASIGRDPNPVPSVSHHRASVNGLTLSSIGGR